MEHNKFEELVESNELDELDKCYNFCFDYLKEITVRCKDNIFTLYELLDNLNNSKSMEHMIEENNKLLFETPYIKYSGEETHNELYTPYGSMTIQQFIMKWREKGCDMRQTLYLF